MKKIILILLSAMILTGLCGCDDRSSEENYLGGKGAISQSEGILQDDTNFYFGYRTLYKFNKENETVSIACQTPGCDHRENNPDCKANIFNSDYTVFNGSLIKRVNQIISNPDGTISAQGYLYLCNENKQVFKNAFPDSFSDEQKKAHTCDIGVFEALGDDNLALICSGFMYILDADFNVKFTVLDMGPYSGGIYFYDDEIYYINNLYRLIKLDKETGAEKAEAVDLNSMKITEGRLYNDTLWFSNEEQSLCSYDFKTGEVREHAKNAVRLTFAGKYVEYLKFSNAESDTSEFHIFNVETGEDKEWELAGNTAELFSADGNYYSYDFTMENKLVRYSSDLSEITKEYTLSE